MMDGSKTSDIEAFGIGQPVRRREDKRFIGEAGACGAPPSIVSAACDALGVAHLDMPLLPETIWHALRQTRLLAAAD